MKVDLNRIRLAVTGMTERVHIGIINKDNTWRHKKDVHDDFLHALITCWKNKTEAVTSVDGKTYEISVRIRELNK